MKSLQKEPTVNKCVNSRLRALQIIGQWKTFYRQKNCVNKETVEIDILVTSKNTEKKSSNTSE